MKFTSSYSIIKPSSDFIVSAPVLMVQLVWDNPGNLDWISGTFFNQIELLGPSFEWRY